MSANNLIAGVVIGVVIGAGGYYLASKNMVEPMSNETTPQVSTELSSASPDFTGEAAIKYRKAVMKAVGGHMGAMGSILKEGDGLGSIADHAAAMAALAKITAAEAFPQKSGPMDGETEALPAIWEKPDDFKKVTMAFVAEAEKLAEVAKGGDKAAIGAQLGALGKNGCKACHDDFRQKK